MKVNHNDLRIKVSKLITDYLRAKADRDSLETENLGRLLDWAVPLYRENTHIGDLSRRLTDCRRWNSAQARVKLDSDSTLATLKSRKYELPLSSFIDSLTGLERIYISLTDSLALADILFARGDIYLIKGETDSAVFYLDVCIDRCVRLDYYSLEGVCYNLQGYIYNTLESDFLQSERAYIEALTCFRKVDHRWRIPYVLTGRIYNYLQLYQTPKAVSLINRAVEEFEQLADSSGIALCKYYLAEALYNDAAYDSAFYYAEQSVRLRRRLSQRKDQPVSDWAYSVSCRALINQALGRYGPAADDFNLADSLFEVSANLQGKDMNLIRWAGLYLDRQEYAPARKLLRTVYDNADSYENNLFSLYGLAVCDFHQQIIQPAVEKLKACINTVEIADRQLPVPDIKTGMLSDKIGFYNLLAEIYIKQFETDSNYSYLDSSFNIVEKSKSRTLVDNLTCRRAGDISQQENDILNKISDLQKRLINGDSSSNSLWEDISLWEDSLHIIRINNASSRSQAAPKEISLTPVRETLADRRTAILEYLFSDFGVSIFVITKDKIEIVSPDIETQKLKKLITEYLQLLAQPPKESGPSEKLVRLGKELYRVLFPHQLTEMKSLTDIVVIPSGIIYHLPLETLLDPNNNYLVEKYNISYLPSVTTGLILSHTPEPKRNGDIVLFGYSPEQPPDTKDDTKSDNESSSPVPFDNLSPLLFCNTEIKNVTSLFEPERVKSNFDSTATETNFKNIDFNKTEYLHIAAHGITDDQYPNRSAVILNFDDDGNDGLLQAMEISGMHIPARLVFLSACQTGTGRTYPGEGVLNLARPFIQAGCRSAIVTYWNINDRFAQNLVKTFYSEIIKGKSISLSLADAKRRALSSPRRQYRHPYYWAPFILIGQGR